MSFNPFFQETIKVYRYGESTLVDGIQTSGEHSILNIKSQVQYTTHNMNFSAEFNEELLGTITIISKRELRIVTQDGRNDIILWDNKIWRTFSSIKHTIAFPHYETICKLEENINNSIRLALESE